MTTALLVRCFSVMGLLVQGALFAFCVFMGGLSDGPGPNPSATLASPMILLPILYFVFCFVSSFPRYRGWLFFYAGIVAHLLIVLAFFQMIRVQAGIFVILPAVTAPFWFLMCIKRLRGHDAAT